MQRGGVNKHSVKEAFKVIDTDGSGAVNEEEFAGALEQLKIEMKPKALKKLWHSIDADGSGEVKVHEFAELVFPDVEMDDDVTDADTQKAPTTEVRAHIKCHKISK